MSSETTRHYRPSRRTVATGAAWAVPVVAVGAAAPALAASPCVAISVTGAIASTNRDRITVTNLGPAAIPAGTTITWQIQNVSGSTAAFVLGTLTRVSTATTPPGSIANNASTTIIFTTTVSTAVGGTVLWEFGINGFTYNSRATMSFAGALAGCPSVSGCVSDRVNTIGSICPTAGFAAAAATAPAEPGVIRRR